MRYLSIDCETTGLDPKVHQVLSVAMIIEDTNDDISVEMLPTFQTYILHGTILGDPVALAMNAKIIERVANRTKGFAYDWPIDFRSNLTDFLTRHRFKTKEDQLFHLTAGGKNVASFDIPFLTNNLDIGGVIKFAHRSIDCASLYFNTQLDKDKLPSLKECCKRAGFEMEAEHTELGDARDFIRCMRFKWRKE